VVEGEIGWIGASSEIHEKAPEGLERGLTTPEQAREFVAATGVDVLAPAVGNMHGLLKSMVGGKSQKRLDIGRIRRIKEATKVFMTLHGASGTNQDDLAEAIGAEMNIVHINTELRLAWRRALESALARSPDVLAPYKILLEPLHAIETVVRSRLELFQGGASRARRTELA
jgi:fructose-bisphosphate aldolase, class II